MKLLGPGTILLRLALIGGLYVIVIVAATINPMPVAFRPYHDFVAALSDVALLAGLIAPFFAIAGALLLRFRQRQRFKALDWVSLVVGVASGLLPTLFVLAYSNCPNGIC